MLRGGGWHHAERHLLLCASSPDAWNAFGANNTVSVSFREEEHMHIGDPVRELQVEPLLYPDALPEAPAEADPARAPAAEPAELPS